MTEPRHRSKKDSRKVEGKVYGRNAVSELFRQRRDDIVRVYLTKPELKRFSALLKWCAETKRAYHLVPSEEMERITESVHHEGVCVLAKRRDRPSVKALLSHLEEARGPIALLWLDGTSNPHNVGSILRTAAHFGVVGVLGEKGVLPGMSASLARVAQGGAEFVATYESEHPKKDLSLLRNAGFSIVATAGNSKKSLYDVQFSERSLFILGAEGEGISSSLKDAADLVLSIPGTGAVESLNVSAACAVILSEYYRQKV